MSALTSAKKKRDPRAALFSKNWSAGRQTAWTSRTSGRKWRSRFWMP
jgi:hypothetical protein